MESDRLTGGLVVDDHTFMRAAMRTCVEQLGISPVDEASSLAEARASLERHVPELCILDLHLPDGSALELLGWLAERDVKVMAMTSADDAYSVRAAYAAGANGYLLKSATQSAVLEGLREILEGRLYADPAVASLLVQGVQLPARTSRVPLTAREVTVLQLVADGLSNAEVAERLGMAPLSVKSHLVRIGRKLGTGDRTQMVAAAMRADLLR